MAVIKMGLVAGQDLDYSKPYEATSTLQWLAVTDSNFDTCSDVYNYGLANLILPLPYVGFHPTLTAHLCRNVKVKQQDGAPRHWTITAEYSSAPTKDEEQEENPLNRPPRVRWRSCPRPCVCAPPRWAAPRQPPPWSRRWPLSLRPHVALSGRRRRPRAAAVRSRARSCREIGRAHV